MKLPLNIGTYRRSGVDERGASVIQTFFTLVWPFDVLRLGHFGFIKNWDISVFVSASGLSSLLASSQFLGQQTQLPSSGNSKVLFGSTQLRTQGGGGGRVAAGGWGSAPDHFLSGFWGGTPTSCVNDSIEQVWSSASRQICLNPVWRAVCEGSRSVA